MFISKSVTIAITTITIAIIKNNIPYYIPYYNYNNNKKQYSQPKHQITSCKHSYCAGRVHYFAKGIQNIASPLAKFCIPTHFLRDTLFRATPEVGH